jgi:predicted transcriptional regulator
MLLPHHIEKENEPHGVMLKAHELQAQGFTQKQIAEQLGKTDRTIRTWLKQMPRKRKTPVRKIC